jgi:GNAT superfamily N-acetyltransferase
MCSLRLSFDPTEVHREVVFEWLRGTYWSPGVRREVFERALEGSLVLSAFIGDAQVGFCRVVTDRATFAWLCDVFVAEGFRGQGVAVAMLSALDGHPDLQTLRRWVLATRDAHGLYARFGYEPVSPERWMERLMPRSGWQEPG